MSIKYLIYVGNHWHSDYYDTIECSESKIKKELKKAKKEMDKPMAFAFEINGIAEGGSAVPPEEEGDWFILVSFIGDRCNQILLHKEYLFNKGFTEEDLKYFE